MWLIKDNSLIFYIFWQVFSAHPQCRVEHTSFLEIWKSNLHTVWTRSPRNCRTTDIQFFSKSAGFDSRENFQLYRRTFACCIHYCTAKRVQNPGTYQHLYLLIHLCPAISCLRKTTKSALLNAVLQ